MGQQDKDRRGWSMVFDDRTDRAADEDQTQTSPERTVAQRAPVFEELEPPEKTAAHPIPRIASEARNRAKPGPAPHDFDQRDDFYDPPTIIDPGIASEIGQALAVDTDPALDDRLANMVVALEEAVGSSDPEETLRTPPPQEGVTFLDQDFQLPRIEEHDDTVFDAGLPPNVEVTQKTKAPVDLMIEHSLPAEARARIERRIPVVERSTRAQRAPPPAASVSPSPAAAERTALDLAAALGMAPEPAAPRPEPVRPQEPELRVPERATPSVEPRGSPLDLREQPKRREGLRSDQLASLASSTSNIAKIIPVILGMFVLLATVMVTVSLMKREERQEHVELRFMAIGDSREVTKASSVGTPVIIETEPPGLLVMFDRKVLGKTPFQAELPLELEDSVVVELTSPYFDRYLGEVKRGPAGDYTIRVDLKRRER